MDTRTLIAFGMLLAVLTVALLKGTLDGAAAKEVLQNIASGLIGGAVGFRVAQSQVKVVPPQAGTPPKGTPTLPVLLLLAGAALMFASCASVPGKTVSMGCVHPDPLDCPDPTAYPSLRAMLPPWPFPQLFVDPDYTPPPPPTPDQEAADRLLIKLGKPARKGP